MKKIIDVKNKFTLAVFVLTTITSGVMAAPQTVTLKVDGMTCPACPLSLKNSLKKVDGVNDITIHFQQREAVVTFDDVKTTIKTITTATENAGYPSTVQK